VTRQGLAQGAAWLAVHDDDLGRLFEADGVPPMWARRPGFSTLLRIILEQQVSLASARAIYRRLVDHLGRLAPQRIRQVGASRLRTLGVTRQKASYCVNVADEILDGRIDLKAIARMADDEVVEALTRIKGIGPWTADVYLLMALRRPDVWPPGDVALIHTVRKVKRLRERPSTSELSEIAEAWRPYRSVAARMLWQHYLSAKRTSRSRGLCSPAGPR